MMNILLTGRPRVGKSTAIHRVITALGKSKVGGFWSKEILNADRRVGFEINTIDGQTGILAHVNMKSGPRLGKYYVNVHDIDCIAVPALRTARKSGKIIIIDEIAKMELFSDSFKSEVIRCLDTGRTVGTIQQRSQPFLDSIRNRSDVIILTVTKYNREQVPERVLDLLN